MIVARRFLRIGAGHPNGFTLLEMLVALTILGFLLVGLNAGVRAGLGVWNRQVRQVGEVTDLTSTARVLRLLLSGIPVEPVANVDRGAPLAILFSGTTEHLQFVGDLPNGLGLSRRAEINLILKDDRLILSWTPRRHEQAATPQSPSDTELLHGVAHLAFAYFGPSAPGETVRWLSQWDGPALPALIRIQLRFINGDTRRWPDLIVAPLLAAPEG